MISPQAPLRTALAILVALLPVSALAFDSSLSVRGPGQDLKDRLDAASLVRTADQQGVSDPQDILAAALADYGRLVTSLYEAGYYGPVVSISIDGRDASGFSPLDNPASVSRVDIVIDTGPEFKFGTAQIGPLAADTTLPKAFATGNTAQTSTIRSAAQSATDAWRAQGHAIAKVNQQAITADHASAQLDVRLGIDPGPVAQLGTLRISGQSAVRPDRIRAIAGIPEGEIFDPTVLERAASRLRGAGAFSSVTLKESATLGPDNALDIDLTVVDAKPRRYGFGAELHSDEGVALSGFWLHRNLRGGAERFRIEGELRGIGGVTKGLDYRLGASLTRPSTFGADTDFYVSGELEKLDEPLYMQTQGQLDAGIQRYISAALSIKAGVSLSYSDVQNSLGTRQFIHLNFPFAATWDRRDGDLSPTSGTFLNAQAMPFVGLQGSASGGRVYLDGRAYRSIGADERLTFAGRIQLGSVLGAAIADTPPDLLFLSGGSGTVRGQSYQSLSITNGGTQTGGRSFLGLSGELRAKLGGKLSTVAFYDAGYIGANSWIDTTGGWHSGAGLGMRYDTGIGPIRLDVGVPVAGGANSGMQIYLGIGQAF